MQGLPLLPSDAPTPLPLPALVLSHPTVSSHSLVLGRGATVEAGVAGGGPERAAAHSEAGTGRPPLPVCPRVGPDFSCPLLSLCVSQLLLFAPSSCLWASASCLSVCLLIRECCPRHMAPALAPAQLLGRVDATRTADGPRSALWPVTVKTKGTTWQDLCTVPREQDLRWLWGHQQLSAGPRLRG